MFLPILMACGVALGQADATENKEADTRVRVQIRKLVQQLDSDQISQREAAEKELEKLGPKILDHLPRITPQTPAEVKTRLERVRKVLETAASKAAAEASKLTLKGKMKLSAALASIEKQTGNKVVDLRNQFGQQEQDVEVELDISDKPFWPAFDELLDKAGMSVYSFANNGDLGIVARNENSMNRTGNATYSGLFRIEPVTLEASRQLRANGSDVLRFKFEVAWEPRSRPIALHQLYSSIKAVDENGGEIPIGNQGGRFEVSVEADVAAAEVLIPLDLPSRDVKKIASFKAELNALVPGRVETFEFADLAAKGQEQEKGGVTVVFEQIRKNLDLYEMRLRVRFDKAANALESHRGWIYENESYLLDADGKKVENSGLQATLTAANEVGVAYLFDLEGNVRDYKLVYKTPALIVQLPIKYELKDIALP